MLTATKKFHLFHHSLRVVCAQFELIAQDFIASRMDEGHFDAVSNGVFCQGDVVPHKASVDNENQKEIETDQV